MRILLTGAGGYVGARIRKAMPVIASPSLRNASQDDVALMIDDAKPDVIIHTAAISDIGICEKNPDDSYRANVLLPMYLAKLAHDAKLIVFSTDQVYGGCAEDGPVYRG